MKPIKAGATSQSIDLFIQDSSSTTGAGLTGLVFNSGSLTAYYRRTGSAAVAISLVTQTATGAFATAAGGAGGGFCAVDGTNMPGVYRLDIPDAAIAAGVPEVVIMLKGATNMAPVLQKIILTAVDLQDSVRGGMTALPNAAAEAAGGLYTRGTGAGQINQPANGRIDANTIAVSGTTQTARDLGASVLLSPGTGTGQISLTSGAVTVGTLANDSVTAAALAADAGTEIAAAVLGATVETGATVVQSLRLANSANGGKASGLATSTVAYRDLADTVDRIAASVDASGNRSTEIGRAHV